MAPTTKPTEKAKSQKQETEPVLENKVKVEAKTDAPEVKKKLLAFQDTELQRELEQFKFDLKKCGVLAESGLLPPGIDSASKAYLVVQQGKELGFGIMQSFANIHVINGRTSISAAAMMALIMRSGEVKIEMGDWSEESCEVTMTRKESSITVVFTIEEAKKAGLVRPASNWVKYPKDMLKARAISRAARVIAPDIIQGMYTEDELQNAFGLTTEAGSRATSVQDAKKIENKELGHVYTDVMKKLVDEINSATEDQISDLEYRISRIAKQELITGAEQLDLNNLVKARVKQIGEPKKVTKSPKGKKKK